MAKITEPMNFEMDFENFWGDLRKFMECLQNCDHTFCADCWLSKQYNSECCPEDKAAEAVLRFLDLHRPDLQPGQWVSWEDGAIVRYGHFTSVDGYGGANVLTSSLNGAPVLQRTYSKGLKKVSTTDRKPSFKKGDWVLARKDCELHKAIVVSSRFWDKGYDEVLSVREADDSCAETYAVWAWECEKTDPPERALYNAYIKCVEAYKGAMPRWTKGKIYKVEYGTLTDDRDHTWSNNDERYHSLNEVNNHFSFAWTPTISWNAKFEEVTEKDARMNCDVKCVGGSRTDSTCHVLTWFDLGETYSVKDGILVSKQGYGWSNNGKYYHSIRELNKHLEPEAKFEELTPVVDNTHKIVCVRRNKNGPLHGEMSDGTPWFKVGAVYDMISGTVNDDQGYKWTMTIESPEHIRTGGEGTYEFVKFNG